MSKPKVQIIYPPEPAPGPLKTWDLYSLGMGTMLGVGVLVYIPTAASSMGARIWWIFPLIVLAAIPYIAHYIFFSSTVRSSGGEVGIVAAATKNPALLGIYQCSQFLQPVYGALFALGFASYFCAFVPSVSPQAAAIGMLTVFYVANLMGTKWMSGLQNVMMPVIYVGFLVFVVFAFMKGDFSLLTKANPEYSIGGSQGFISGAFLLYSMSTGYYSCISYGRLANNSRKDTPKALLLSIVSTVIIYTFLGIATVVVLPIGEIGTTLTAVAGAIFPSWLFPIWMVLIPMLLIATTVNGFLAAQVEQLSVASMNGFLPIAMNKENRFGAKWPLATVCYLMGCVPIVIGMQVSDLAAYLTLMLIVVEFMGYFYLYRLPKVWKKYWETSTMHCPNWLFYLFITAAVLIKIVLTIIALATMKLPYVIFTAVYMLLAVVWCINRMNTGKAKIQVQAWADGVNVADPQNLEVETV